MLALSANDKVFLCIGHLDFRRQVKGLIKATQEILKQNPYSRAYFVFTNKKKTSVKILHYDGTGYWLHWKILSEGKFFWPKLDSASCTMSPMELQVLLSQGNPVQAAFREEWVKVA